jgi:hypothetical protein
VDIEVTRNMLEKVPINVIVRLLIERKVKEELKSLTFDKMITEYRNHIGHRECQIKKLYSDENVDMALAFSYDDKYRTYLFIMENHNQGTDILIIDEPAAPKDDWPIVVTEKKFQEWKSRQIERIERETEELLVL